MLELYNELLIEHKTNNTNKQIITCDIITTVLNNLSIYLKKYEAISIFDEYLEMNDSSPDINNFCMMFKLCSWIRDWNLCKKYFNLMYKKYNIKPNSICFRYILQCCAYCRPPKYEEALSILYGMKTDWNIEPNAHHFASVIYTLATPWKYILNPLSQDITIQIENNNDYNKYKFKLLHGRLFDNLNKNILNKSDLQNCLNLFHEMIDKYNIIPNDRIFAQIFYACDKSNNLNMALKYRLYWKNNFPQIRQQGLSFLKLITICANLSSWKDAIEIYKSTALLNYSESKTHKNTDNSNTDFEDNEIEIEYETDLIAAGYDLDPLALEAYHKTTPDVNIFNQLIRCAKNDISREIYENGMNIEEAEKITLKRIHYIQSQMYEHRYNPNDRTWMFLLQTASIIQSVNLCNRFIKRLFQYSMKPQQLELFTNWGNNENFFIDKINKNKKIPNEFKDNDNTFNNCWDYYDINKINLKWNIFKSMINSLYWTNQINKALMLYHDCYYIKKSFTHWHTDNNNKINIDLHESDTATAAITLIYIFKNEFENIYYNILCDNHIFVEQHKNSNKLQIDIELNDNLDINKKNNKKIIGKNLNIITGKGTGNPDGISILRPWIKNFLANEINPSIKSHIHPRNLGMLVLDSQDVLNYIQANKKEVIEEMVT